MFESFFIKVDSQFRKWHKQRIWMKVIKMIKKKCNLLENLAKDRSEWREYDKENILDSPLLSANTQT